MCNLLKQHPCDNTKQTVYRHVSWKWNTIKQLLIKQMLILLLVVLLLRSSPRRLVSELKHVTKKQLFHFNTPWSQQSPRNGTRYLGNNFTLQVPSEWILALVGKYKHTSASHIVPVHLRRTLQIKQTGET